MKQCRGWAKINPAIQALLPQLEEALEKQTLPDGTRPVLAVVASPQATSPTSASSGTAKSSGSATPPSATPAAASSASPPS
jgi:hypothetical protein